MSQQFGEAASPKVRPRSFFTRKIEAKLQERDKKVPQTFLTLLDTPFDRFSPEELALYEEKVKPTFQFFSGILLEVFDQLGCPEEGWEESTKLMPDCPAKVVAMLALYEYRQSSAAPDDPLNIMDDYAPPPQPAQQPQQPRSPMERITTPPPPPEAQAKKVIKKPVQGKGEGKPGKWWEKKVF